MHEEKGLRPHLSNRFNRKGYPELWVCTAVPRVPGTVTSLITPVTNRLNAACRLSVGRSIHHHRTNCKTCCFFSVHHSFSIMLAARFATHRGSHRLVGKLHQRLSLGGAQVVRTFSASNEKEPTFSQYEYPSRTEAPEITTTNAKDITLEQIDSSTTSKLHLEWDPFDDQSKFTPSERDKLRSSLKASLDSLKLSTLPITENVPDFIPPNFPSGELQVPLTEITTLDNGVRVVSQVRSSISSPPIQTQNAHAFHMCCF